MNEAVIQALRGKYPAEGEVGRRVSRLGGPSKAQGLYEEYAGLGMPDFLAAFEEQTKEAGKSSRPLIPILNQSLAELTLFYLGL